MKKKMITSVVSFIMLLFSYTSFSQKNTNAMADETPAWVSDKGYWVVESNIHIPKHYTVRFYNNAHTLVGRKDIDGMRLNMKKSKTKMLLKSMLESSLSDWAIAHPAAINEDLAAKP